MGMDARYCEPCSAESSTRRGEALRRPGPGCRPPCVVGWRGSAVSGTPPQRFPARTAASDGHCASTRAARSAEIWFAVRSLSDAIDREKSPAPVLAPHPPLTRSPFPSIGEGLNTHEFEARLSLAGGAIAYCLLPIASQLLTPNSSLPLYHFFHDKNPHCNNKLLE